MHLCVESEITLIQMNDYLKSQIGNSEGNDIPNKKYYDPRVWLRKAEESFIF